jgi:hypothetical protein
MRSADEVETDKKAKEKPQKIEKSNMSFKSAIIHESQVVKESQVPQEPKDLQSEYTVS